jgi:phosphoglycolate phosphatase
MGLICFDLDGTLVDPLRAMVHCIERTCHELGVTNPSWERVAPFIGFGPGELFTTLPGLEDPDRVDEAIALYWSHFEDSGIAKHRVYDGIPLMLTRLRRQGHRLHLVTTKPTRYARRVLHEFDLLLAFDEVFGTAPRDWRKSKGDVLAELRAQGVVQLGGYMVGDRADDMASGKANGLIPLGVTYGFGSASELQDAGADKLFPTPAALDEWFQTRLPGSEIHDAFSLSE